MSRLTVLHLVPQDSWRGAQVYAGRLRDALAHDPDQHHLVAALFDGPTAGLRADVVVSGRPGRARRFGLDVRVVRRLRSLVQSEHADVVVAHGGEALKYAVLASGSVPVVYYKVGLSTAELSRPWHRKLYTALAQRTSLGVAVSTTVLDQMRDVLGMPAEDLRVIPNARDPHTYRPSEGGAATAAGATERPLVLFVGQLEEGKRPGLFLDVVARLRSGDVPHEAAIVGDGTLRSALAPRARSLGVELLGVRDDVPALLRGAAVLVMTSAADTEGMPGVLIEAGMSGIPVVTTTAAGARDVVVDGVTGFVVDDVDGLAARLAELLRDDRLRLTTGAQARARCEELFSIETGAARWHRAVSEVADRARSRTSAAALQ